MKIGTMVDTLREEFYKQLDTTGAYNKAGMQIAFEKAASAALMRLITQELEK